MWSKGAVANLKASLKQPGVRFETAKKEPAAKVYKGGETIASLDSEDPAAIQAALQKHLSAPTDAAAKPEGEKKIAKADGNNENNEDNINTITSTTINKAFINKTTKIILDSGAFITGTNLAEYGPDCEYYTIQEVIDELLDEQAKYAFKTFPYPITVKVPSTHSMNYINSISMQTGDYYVLSLTDRKVLALCHQLEIETNGDKHIHYNIAKPTDMSTGNISSSAPTPKDKSNAQKKAPEPKKMKQTTTTTTDVDAPKQTDPKAWALHQTVNTFDLNMLLSEDSTEYNTTVVPIADSTIDVAITTTAQGYEAYPSIYESYTPSSTVNVAMVQREAKNNNSKFILPGFDDGAWLSADNVDTLQKTATKVSNISMSASTRASALTAKHLLPHATVTTSEQPTTLSIKQSQQQAKQGTINPNARALVGGITTDYSMQNVMLQAGLQCLTIDGRAISTIRQYIMGCHACYTLSKDLSRGFCPSCGGFTMVRLIVEVDKRGRPHYKWPLNRIFNTRGTIFQISKKATFGSKKGQGKIILREDMLPKPKLKEILIARGEKKAATSDGGFDDAALFGMIRNFDAAKSVTYGYGKRNMNVVRKKRR